MLFVLSGLLTPVPPPVRYGVVVALAVAGVLRDAQVVSFPLPQNARQVPQEVLTGQVARGSLQFGFEMGTGVRTYVSSTVPYVLVAALLLTAPGLLTALAAGLGFGAGRSLMPVSRYLSRDGELWDAELHAHLPAIKLTAGVAVALALTLLMFS
ncbi:hypothetical protein ACFPM7_21445 [Actinokineospora guangxiensis]|uniref:DUF1772 domain-containing protein n=1 Tax=Actinokineospora guangxiensis TaxID=1490288 RepID=A0ABW0ETY5_9PSEU